MFIFVERKDLLFRGFKSLELNRTEAASKRGTQIKIFQDAIEGDCIFYGIMPR